VIRPAEVRYRERRNRLDLCDTTVSSFATTTFESAKTPLTTTTTTTFEGAKATTTVGNKFKGLESGDESCDSPRKLQNLVNKEIINMLVQWKPHNVIAWEQRTDNINRMIAISK
jgi:hypothetical protein